MGLRWRLARYAAERPRPFVVQAAGGTRARLAVEAELRRRAWRQAESPAETGLLVVCGDPGSELAEAVETVWLDAPGPRARVRVRAFAPEVAAALDRAVEELADVDAQRADAEARIAEGPWAPHDAGAHGARGGMDHGAHGGMDHGARGGMDHRAHDGMDHGAHGGMDHGAHGGMDHGAGHAHPMAMRPGGLAMAERADDRDGLRLDVLHVPLGPVLASWPAGLRIGTTLQGDVVQAAEVSVVDRGDGASFWDAGGTRRHVAERLDGLGRLLHVAGWSAAADRAALLRDEVLDGASRGVLEPRAVRFARRVGRSRALRWMTRGIGTLAPEAAERHGLPAHLTGDVADRLDGWLAGIRAGLPSLDGDGGAAPAPRADVAAVLAVLPGLLAGADLAAVRLTVASLDPDLARLRGAWGGVRRGARRGGAPGASGG